MCDFQWFNVNTNRHFEDLSTVFFCTQTIKRFSDSGRILSGRGIVTAQVPPWPTHTRVYEDKESVTVNKCITLPGTNENDVTHTRYRLGFFAEFGLTLETVCSDCTWGHTPSTASTTTMAPSHSLTAVETSEEKSTWPGESIRLIKYSWSPERQEEHKHIQTLFGEKWNENVNPRQLQTRI